MSIVYLVYSNPQEDADAIDDVFSIVSGLWNFLASFWELRLP